MPWGDVQRYAEKGAPEQEIIDAFGISEDQLAQLEISEHFRAALKRGHALYRLRLRERIEIRGNHTHRGAGSVHALALQARNHLDWDREVPRMERPPDLVGARERLRSTLERLAKARSQVEGRTVTPLELVQREAFSGGVEPPPEEPALDKEPE